MQTTVKKPGEKTRAKQELATPRKSLKEEDVLKKGNYNVATPKSFLQKSSAVDIYGRTKRTAVQSARAPKKVVGLTHTSKNATPTTKDYLKSSPSSISQISSRSGYEKTFKSDYEKTPRVGAFKKMEFKSDSKTSLTPAKTPRTAKDLPFVNVTVNSPPPARRKLNLGTENKVADRKKIDSKEVVSRQEKNNSREVVSKKSERSDNKEIASRRDRGDSKEITSNKLERDDSKEIGTRQRTKTRTLDENEVKVLTHDVVDNNAEMINLAKKLHAKPKAFYVDIEEGNTRIKEKISDEEVSYEDDFESYESDFDSYHSDQTNSNHKETSENENDSSDQNVSDPDPSDQNDFEDQNGNGKEENGELVAFGESVKESKDDERMLDSGNFDLRDRSAGKFKPAPMAFILEDSEDDKRQSLTDEGFQDMSSSSAVSSMKTHVDVLDRPLFIDFSKSKETKRKRKLNERLKQRAQDLLSMITLHEMSYVLFEMKSIPYDLYMATFGRSNYTQIAVQTFDDGITEEIQTEEIESDHKWTQHPIEFSKHDVYLYPQDIDKRYGKHNEDYLTKFSSLINKNVNVEIRNKINIDKSYKENPLRIYFEQNDGVGACEMLPYEKYKSKLENNDFNAARLRKFLKKVESRVSNILSLNCGDKNLTELARTTKLPFSKGYVSISPRTNTTDNLSFLKFTKISNLIFSKTKNNLLLSVHKKSSKTIANKCIMCLWDISVARTDPIKILTAIDNVTVGRYRGNSDGVFVAALEDGSVHLWDLSEEPTWRNDVASEEKPANLVEVSSDRMTQTEIDREWNLKNSNVGTEQLPLPYALQACAYTNSASNMDNTDIIDAMVGLEFVGDAQITGQDGGRKIVGQICTLQRIGIITLWSIVQEKKTIDKDKGKAYWSKMKLEKSLTINLIDHIDIPILSTTDEEIISSFNLNASKRRLSNRKTEKIALKKEISRPKSTSSSEFDISRPASAASSKKVLPVETKHHQNWESGILCCDLKIISLDKKDSYLVAKNGGEVLFCTRFAGSVKVERFCVAADTSTITCLDVSPHGLPYFLAATETGTVNLCSLVNARVLLTLDCRNGPPADIGDRCHSDHKGRYISSGIARSPTHRADVKLDSKLSITSLHWSHSNPCSMYMLIERSLHTWDLTHSDICAKSVTPQCATVCGVTDGVMALLTPEEEIQVHRLTTEQYNTHHLDLFQKYVTLL